MGIGETGSVGLVVGPDHGHHEVHHLLVGQQLRWRDLSHELHDLPRAPSHSGPKVWDLP